MRLVKNNKIIVLSYVIAIITFVISFILGFGIEDEFEKVEAALTVNEIFWNNTFISMVFFSGSITLGFVNLLLSFYNGFIFGTIFKYSFMEIGVMETFIRIAPHGVFEIPSILISTSIGYIPLLLIVKKANKRGKIQIKRYLKYYLYSFLLVIALNLIAAIIEGTVSFHI